MSTISKKLTALVVSTILATTAISLPAFADGDHHGSSRIDRLAEKLELSDAQTVSLTEIMEAQKEKRQALRDQGLSREEMRSEMKTIRDETVASLETILSEEQLNTMHEMMERGKGHRHGMNKQDESES